LYLQRLQLLGQLLDGVLHFVELLLLALPVLQVLKEKLRTWVGGRGLPWMQAVPAVHVQYMQYKQHMGREIHYTEMP